MLRTQLYADPAGRFVHELVLQSCRQNNGKTALIDTSCDRRFTFAEYGIMRPRSPEVSPHFSIPLIASAKSAINWKTPAPLSSSPTLRFWKT